MQAEVAGLRVQIATMQDVIVNLTHENTLLKRRLYGNKTEKSHTSELQLTLGNLLDSEKELRRSLSRQLRRRVTRLRVRQKTSPLIPQARRRQVNLRGAETCPSVACLGCP